MTFNPTAHVLSELAQQLMIFNEGVPSLSLCLKCIPYMSALKKPTMLGQWRKQILCKCIAALESPKAQSTGGRVGDSPASGRLIKSKGVNPGWKRKGVDGFTLEHQQMVVSGLQGGKVLSC